MYEVDWLETALRELGVIWQAADETTRAAVSRAVARMNDRLSLAPLTQGETRPPEGTRILFELPLKVLYRIERFEGAVSVLHVWLIPKRRRK